ncbi:MAG TPA: S24/S26 family peptidase [Verrucomicrobiae bacterium]|nr:S24/S26 family peptidase [Verrucomicrobiae bacterium]
MNLGLSLRMDLAAPVWLKAKGTSMFPWRIPGCEVRIEPAGPALEVGLIVVFRRGAKLYYHRVIKQVSSSQWQTKGDTLIDSDDPISDNDIVGRVTAVRRGNCVRAARPDADAAWLSDRLGGFFRRLGPSSGCVARFGRRALYLAVLLNAWPFRRLLARQEFGSGTEEAARVIDEG